VHFYSFRQAVRSSIDVLVAIYCNKHDYTWLHHRAAFDMFDAFESLRGLRVWRH
jgi:hypothetical protein